MTGRFLAATDALRNARMVDKTDVGAPQILDSIGEYAKHDFKGF